MIIDPTNDLLYAQKDLWLRFDWLLEYLEEAGPVYDDIKNQLLAIKARSLQSVLRKL